MTFVEIVLLGVGLAMDCFAVSLSKGIAARRLLASRMLLMAVLFGLFQAGMPLIGYFAGTYFASVISKVAPWIALVLLGFIGGKMIWEYFKEGDESAQSGEAKDADALKSCVDYSLRTLLLMSVATSIDALATGLLFVGNNEAMTLAVVVIGICSFLFSVLGSLIGVFAGKSFKFPAELLGGVILCGIGLKIWIEGLFF